MDTRLRFARTFFTALVASMSLFACKLDRQIGGQGGDTTTTTTSDTTSSSTTSSDTTSSTTSSSTTSSLVCNEPTTPKPDCEPKGSSTLPGVRIEILPASCHVSLSAAGPDVALVYSVVVDEDVAGVTPDRAENAFCEPPGPSGLIVYDEVAGDTDHCGEQRWCRCDVGLCDSSQMPPTVTLKKGSYPTAVAWSGNNWNGPSDTFQQEGPPFPLGTYSFNVVAKGTVMTAGGEVPFEITASMPIYVTE